MVELLLILAAAAAAAAAALAGLGYLLVWFLLHGRRDGPGWEKLEGFRYAHRGLHGPGVPENSLAAFRRAAEAGYGAELDVHLTRDGRLVVIHDGDLERMCGVPGRVAEKPRRSLPLSGWQAQRNTSLFWRRCSPCLPDGRRWWWS